MKRVLHFALLLISAIALLASCEKAPFITMTGPRSFNFTRDGGSQSITFSCNRPWSVSSTESWIQISPSSGEASDKEITVTIKCSPNTTYDPRSATVTVKLEELSESITITQDTGIGLLVSPTIFELTNAAQVIEIEVQKNVQYSVAIDDESAKWIKQGGTKALSTDKVTFTISANESYDNREGKITFKQLDGDLSQTVTVRQSQTNGLFITTPDYNLSNEAHTLSVEVKANVEFEVTSQTEWIKYVETKALTPSTITLSVEANESYDNRTGTVLVKQKNGDLTGTITVSQKQTDFLHTPSTSFNLTSEAQNITLEIQDNVSYSIVIPDDAKSWISIVSNTQTKALVDDQVVLAIAKNTTYDDREASVTIKQVDGALAGTVNIKQAYGEGLVVEKKTYDVAQAGGSIEVVVNANVEYEVTSNEEWIHYIETKALSSSTISLLIDSNEALTKREGSITISQKSGNLSQVVTFKQAEKKGIVVEKTEYELGPERVELDIQAQINVDYAIELSPYGLLDGGSAILDEGINKTIRVIVAQNLSEEDRSAIVTIKETGGSSSQTIKISQKKSVYTYTAEAVDLGLSVKWSSLNLGASNPKEFGAYFAFGEVSPKSNYSWETYKWCQGTSNTLTKYCNNSNNGTVDNKKKLDPEDDAAQVKLGEGWRIPTFEEWEELTNPDNCTITFSSSDGVSGATITSKITGNSIFLPVTHWARNYGIASNLEGMYWVSNIIGTDPTYIRDWHVQMSLNYERVEEWGTYRDIGISIRPVKE